MDPAIIFITTLTFVASVIAIIAGFGTSTIMIPILINFISMPEALLLTGILHWFNDSWRLLLFKDGIWWKELMFSAVPGVIASLIGALLVIRIPQQYLLKSLGIMLLAYVVFIYVKPRFKLRPTKLYAISGGAFAGFVSGLLGVSGEVTSMLLTTLDLPKAIFIGTGGAFTLMIDVSRVFAYLREGISLDSSIRLELIAYIPASLLGSLLGREIVEKIPQDQFRKIVAIFLLIAGINLVFFP